MKSRLVGVGVFMIGLFLFMNTIPIIHMIGSALFAMVLYCLGIALVLGVRDDDS